MYEFKMEIHVRRNQGCWDGKYLYQIVGQSLADRSPYYHIVQPGHCMLCGRPLNKHYMFFSGGASKSLCEDCYQNNIVNRINKRCILSGQRLPQCKTDMQGQSPREVEYNIADGAAFDKWCILHEKVTYGDMTWLADEQDLMQEQGYHKGYRPREILIIEEVFHKKKCSPAKTLPPRIKGELPPARHQKMIDFSPTDKPENNG